MVKSIKSENGITLVVLIVTIIVLTILTTITVNLSFGPDGILQKATKINFLEDISDLQKNIDEREIVARANGQSNDNIKSGLEEELKKWKEANKKYSNIKFDLILDENNEFILTYNSGASRNQEVWLESVSFPGV